MKNGMIVDEFGDKYWYKNDLLHRTNGPAIIYLDGYEYWYFEGKRHRTDGPAIIEADGSKQWWLDGTRMTPVEWVLAVAGIGEEVKIFYMT
jgi:hypothetical protein